MLGISRKKIRRALIIILIAFSGPSAIAAIVFFSRSPVLIVTDDPFNRIYGLERLGQARSQLSMELFRRVIPVLVAETVGSDLISIAVETAAKKPKMVLFPYRYLAGANFYSDKHPGVPVFIIGGERPVNQRTLTFIRTNTEEAMYRVGLCAAILAGEGRVLFFGDGTASDHHWEAFRMGLSEQNYSGNPVFLNISVDFPSYSEVGCVVLAGPASRFLEKNLAIPVILFSWIDPAMTPMAVKVIFDDSPWALAAGDIRKFTVLEDEILVSSRPLIVPGRIGEKNDFRRLQQIIKTKHEKR